MSFFKNVKFSSQILTLLGRGRAVSAVAEQCQNFDTARPRPSSVKIFFSNFDTARPWPSSVKILTLLGRGRVSKFFFQILTLLGRGRAVSKFFFQILTLLGRGRAVSKFFFQILTLLGRGRAVSKFFFQILTLHSAVAVVAHTHARARVLAPFII